MRKTLATLVFVSTLSAWGSSQAFPHQFIRGDVLASGSITIADPILVLVHLFLSPVAIVADCEDAADWTDDEFLDLSDAVASLNFQYLGGPPPPLPFPSPPYVVTLSDCGVDPGGTLGDPLLCLNHAFCP